MVEQTHNRMPMTSWSRSEEGFEGLRLSLRQRLPRPLEWSRFSALSQTLDEFVACDQEAALANKHEPALREGRFRVMELGILGC